MIATARNQSIHRMAKAPIASRKKRDRFAYCEAHEGPLGGKASLSPFFRHSTIIVFGRRPRQPAGKVKAPAVDFMALMDCMGCGDFADTEGGSSGICHTGFRLQVDG
jgi:hypothetical protein